MTGFMYAQVILMRDSATWFSQDWTAGWHLMEYNSQQHAFET